MIAAALLIALAAPAVDAPEPMRCETGPVMHQFAGQSWEVFSCADGKTLVAISARVGEVEPDHLILSSDDGTTYRVTDPGQGDTATLDAIAHYRAADFAALLAATKAAK